MLKFLRDRKVGKGKKDYFHELSIIAKEEREKVLRERIREIVLEEFENSGIKKRIDDVSNSVKDVDKKLEILKSSLVPLSRSKSDTIRKIKMKRMIIELLTKHKRLTSSDLSNYLNLSRTRCSEYLTELERDGVANGVLISRQKFYELNNQ
ncbi:MAG: winged helix-turn-helix transcriptional regulator [Candidatus Aenigmarchaeota archaeon]|nr:winged helix-turn-helix transcriptional regulator [Candidatus Aenigmarchaeota archaeon]NIQ17745.1 winged helix-turn-helix transcriptional regulator [Candidatus Aenigmarchaeota archaeon]NIS73065.1 winged helix-turn-helix transcriptional regulator [Candidatus Aenigmarchaeota archaeon]